MPRFRRALGVLFVLLAVPMSLAAKDAYLSVGGSVGAFRTDARIFNPSFIKDITVNASFLPSGNVSNAGVTPKAITIPKRQMAVYDDVVSSLFASSGLGAIRLTSDDDFVATQRIYAAVADGTLGQFVPGLDATAALKKGVLVQMKSNGIAGTKGTFRTNVGFVNPNATAANVILSLFDKTNTVVGQNVTLKIEAFGVVSPSSVAVYFNNPVQDLSDAWLSFESDQSIFAYASVVDNGTTDPTFIPASADSGIKVQVDPPPPVTVTVSAGPSLSFSPDTVHIHPGDTIKWAFSNGTHNSISDNGSTDPWNSGTKSSGQTFSKTFNSAGTFSYFCSFHGGSGGIGMSGTIIVDPR